MEDHRNKKHLKPQKLTFTAALPSINRMKKICCKATGQSILITANKKFQRTKVGFHIQIPKRKEVIFAAPGWKVSRGECGHPEVNLPVPLCSPAASWCERGSALLQSEVSLCTYRHTCPCPVTSLPRLSAERPERGGGGVKHLQMC